VSEPPIRMVRTDDLLPDEVASLRALFDGAWSNKDGTFTDEDWGSASGGTHVIASIDDRIVAHASVVDRVLETGDLVLRTGYVEAVATWPAHQGRGYATKVMNAVGALLDGYELGALDTGIPAFYERLGWDLWRGPTAVRTERGVIGTPEEDGLVMVLLTPNTPQDLDLDARISCDWRPGDVW
jgi:aminoglycoside 2'-N-acetyltransferase I